MLLIAVSYTGDVGGPFAGKVGHRDQFIVC